MGGDFAPDATVLGAIAAYKALEPQQKLVLIGDKNLAQRVFAEQNFSPDLIEFIHTTETIGMGEHPTKAITQKPNSSIGIGFSMLKAGEIDSFSSAGNTGAMLVGAMFSVKTVPGVIRPAISSVVPKVKKGYGIMLDVGANADCKPDTLLQFGVLGSLFVENIHGVANPRVGLINIGEEEGKGNMLMIATHSLMKETNLFNFVGNVEGRDMFYDKADVIVCDGFTGNVILKLAETFYDLTRNSGFENEFFAKFNYEQYGGSPILGVNAPVIIGHGISTPEAIKNMVLLSRSMITTKLIDKIKAAFK
ncbi:Phosphate:acyl-ACP acyltransferase PlsX [Arcticibacter svalbardensis MN12-7]|uniref:Phosphate acyltransferase n=2 Tax=Arcticibacter TaxID=1288026 RepID=R9GUD7_9SPHI|nr:Phosphate:acyl-ACP acyltransferase PlsX [Arcticibacter svalbardensis MN12-7]